MRNPSSTTSTKADGFRRLEVITGVGRRRRWSDEDKARIVAEGLDPATTASAVARRYGLHVSQLFTWRQQLQRRASAATCSGSQSSALRLANRAHFRLTLNGTEGASGLTINATGLTFAATGSQSAIMNSH